MGRVAIRTPDGGIDAELTDTVLSALSEVMRRRRGDGATYRVRFGGMTTGQSAVVVIDDATNAAFEIDQAEVDTRLRDEYVEQLMDSLYTDGEVVIGIPDA